MAGYGRRWIRLDPRAGGAAATGCSLLLLLGRPTARGERVALVVVVPAVGGYDVAELLSIRRSRSVLPPTVPVRHGLL